MYIVDIQFKCFPAPNGGSVYVGRNARENEYLTFVFADKHDLWFHVKDLPGSHVLLRNGCDNLDIQFAAEKAAEHSKYKDGFREGKLVQVEYCNVLDVSKPKWSPLGEVQITNEKVVYVQKQNSP